MSQPRPTAPWWALAVAAAGLAVAAGLVLAGRATLGEAGVFLTPLFTFVGAAIHSGSNQQAKTERPQGSDT